MSRDTQKPIKHGEFEITVRRESAFNPKGYVAYVDWGPDEKGEFKFCAHIRSPSYPLGRYPTKSEAIAEATARCSILNCGEPYMTILAEYCDATLFTGWHLYEREHADGRRNSDGGWGWLRGGFDCHKNIVDAIRGMGVPCEGMPDPKRHSHDFVEWFAQRFPFGIRAIIGPYHSYIPLPLDQQPTGVVRLAA